MSIHHQPNHAPFYLNAEAFPIASVRLLPTASQHVGTSKSAAKGKRDQLCFLVVLANGGGQWISHRSPKSLKNLLAHVPLLPRYITATSLKTPKRSFASTLFSTRDTAYEVYEAAIECLLAWLFSDVTDHEFQTGSNPRIRAWFAPDDVRKSSRQAAQEAQDQASALASPRNLPSPSVASRSTSSLPQPPRSSKALAHTSSRLRLELNLDGDEDDWAPDNWLAGKGTPVQRASGSTPNLLSSAMYASPVNGGELRATVSNATGRFYLSPSPPRRQQLSAHPSPDPGRTPTLKSFPSTTTLRQVTSSSLVPSSTPPSLRPVRSLKNIRSFGDLKAAAKESLGLSEKAKKELVPPVPKVEDWQRDLARALPTSPIDLESAFVLKPPQRPRIERQGSSGSMPPMSSPPRMPLPAVPSGPSREMPRLKASRSLDLLRGAANGSESALSSPMSSHQPTAWSSRTTEPHLAGSTSYSSISSIASSTASASGSGAAINSGFTSTTAPPSIPPRKTSLGVPPRPTSRPNLPRHISTTTYGGETDVVLKLLYPEGQCNILLRVPMTVTLAQVKSSVHAKFASSGVTGVRHLPAASGDWGLAYSSITKQSTQPLFEEDQAFSRYELPDCPSFDYARRHIRGASSSTTGSSTYTARSSLSMSSGRASTTMTSPSIASRPASLSLITTESDWQEALKGWREGKLAFRIMC